MYTLLIRELAATHILEAVFHLSRNPNLWKNVK